MLNLRSKVRRDLLAYFFTNPESSHHLREIAQLLSADPANLSRELARLERDGLFLSQKVGNQRHFSLNRQHPLYRELQGIVFKTVGATGLLRSSLQKVAGIEEAYLYGSFARNREDSISDIDILLIGHPNPNDLEARVRELERKLKRELNYIIISPEELAERLEGGDAFLRQVWQDTRIRLIPPT
jgi:predicted nucleotidyltransferase